MQCRVLSPGDFAKLQVPWNTLVFAAERPCPFLTWEWLQAWLESDLGYDAKPWMLTAWEDGRLVGAAPLCRDAGTIRFLSVAELAADYADFLVAPGAQDRVLETFAQELRESTDWTRLTFEGYAPDSHVERFAPRLTDFGTSEQEECSICPVLDIAGGWEQVLKRRFDRKRRYNIQREIRLAIEKHGLASRTASRMDEVPGALDTLFRLHRARKMLQRIDSRFAEGRNAAFHRRAATRFQAAGWLALDVIEKQGMPVAALYGFRFGARFWLYQTGLDQAGAIVGAGSFALASRISQSADEGMREFDFLRGDESYKRLWTDREVPLRTLHVFRSNFRGRLMHRLWSSRRTMARAARMLKQRDLSRSK